MWKFKKGTWFCYQWRFFLYHQINFLIGFFRLNHIIISWLDLEIIIHFFRFKKVSIHSWKINLKIIIKYISFLQSYVCFFKFLNIYIEILDFLSYSLRLLACQKSATNAERSQFFYFCYVSEINRNFKILKFQIIFLNYLYIIIWWFFWFKYQLIIIFLIHENRFWFLYD